MDQVLAQACADGGLDDEEILFRTANGSKLAAAARHAVVGFQVDEFEPDPARGASPGDERPSHAPISHLELVRHADAYAIVPASALYSAIVAYSLRKYI